jgi:hypothetical protein
MTLIRRDDPSTIKTLLRRAQAPSRRSIVVTTQALTTQALTTQAPSRRSIVVTTNEMIGGHAEMLKGRRLRMNALNSEHYMTCKHMR